VKDFMMKRMRILVVGLLVLARAERMWQISTGNYSYEIPQTTVEVAMRATK
jgi:hypothetical protein